MKYQQIIFDIDGTLIDTEYAVLHSLQDTLKTLCNKGVPPEELTFALGITSEDALKRFPVENMSAAVDLWNENEARYKDTITMFAGIPEALEALLRLGCEMGIITSKTREEYENSFVHFGICQYFKTVICADDTTEHKPTPVPILKYMELTGSERARTLYVGDSKYDAMCARAAGVDFGLAVWGSHTESMEADYYFRQPSEIVAAVKKDSQ